MAAPRSPPPRQLPVNRLTGCAPWRRCSYQFLSPYRPTATKMPLTCGGPFRDWPE